MVRSILLALVMSSVVPGVASAARATAQVSFDDRALAVSLWYPDRVPVIRGVLVITGGQASGDRSGDTRRVVDSKFYQRVAESMGFALLGNQFRGAYPDAASGTGQALLDALAALADKTRRPELAHAPLLLHGFSNGGYFGFTFAQWKPERVIAFCLNKSGFAAAPLDAALLATPGLFIYGELEVAKGLPTVVPGLVREGRSRGALWAELLEWGRGHEEGEVERVMLPFFADMVAARYPKDASPLHGLVPLGAIDERAGWLGDHRAIGPALPQIASWDGYLGDRTAASWLPNEGIAQLWRGFVAKEPFALRAPGPNAQLPAAQLLLLTAAGLSAGDRVTFYSGARALTQPLAAGAGRARARWKPDRSGVQGIVATAGARTSRPVAIVLYGAPAAPL
jgi:hypothetical protein